MNCPNCGNEVRGNFCTNCGTRIEQAQASPPSPSEIDPGATAAIRPGDLTNLAERESAGPQSGPPAGDPGATAMLRPEDLQGLRPGAEQPAAGPEMGPAGQQPYAPPGPGPGNQQPSGNQQPYGSQSPGPGGQPPYETPGMQPGGQQPYGTSGGPGSGQQPYGAPGSGPTATPPSGGNWARELGVATPQSSYGGSGGAPAGASPRLVFPGGASIDVPPGISQALTRLEPVGKQYLAWIGAALVIIGLFVNSKTITVSATGLFTVSAAGSGNFWDWAPFWGTIILILALAAAGVAFLRDYKWLLPIGGLLLIILIFQFLYTFSAGVSSGTGYSVGAHPSWGWILLFPGALAVLAAAVMRPHPRDNPDDHGVERLIGGMRGGTGPR